MAGFLSGLFGGVDEAIQPYQTFAERIGIIIRLPPGELVRHAQKIAKGRLRTEGQGAYRATRGDELLVQAKADPTKRMYVEMLRREGVRDEDLRSLYQIPLLAQFFIDAALDIVGGYIMRKSQHDGMSASDAAHEIRRHLPIFGDPTDTRFTSDDDRPLPFEIRPRVVFYLSLTPAWMLAERELRSFNTFNGWLRSKIQAGAL